MMMEQPPGSAIDADDSSLPIAWQAMLVPKVIVMRCNLGHPYAAHFRGFKNNSVDERVFT
jgi:hypothetical protein